jgi:4a-hydroxytetrahydrobiopterin dehydratase
MDSLTGSQIEEAGLCDWRKLAQALHARFRYEDPAAAAAFVAGVVALTGRDGRMPELRLQSGLVDVVVATHVDGVWVTTGDVEVARAVGRLAAEHGLRPHPEEVAQVELALDTADGGAHSRFWAALLTGSPDNQVVDTVFDPTGRVPSLWFQPTEPHDTPRQRWHLDVWVAPEAAPGRIAAAVAAGGTVLYDPGNGSVTILRDPEGNRVCVCSSRGRD